MGDRLRVRRRQLGGGPRGMTAAAKILRPIRLDDPAPQAWQGEAWAMRDSVGELRQAETWLVNQMSRARLVAATRAEPGAEPVPLPPEHPASVAVQEGLAAHQAGILRAFGTQLLTPGEGYLVGEDTASGKPAWKVVSGEQVRLSASYRDAEGVPLFEVSTGPGTADWRPVAGLVTRVYRPDPRRNWLPDSPVRGALAILRRLVLLHQHIEATATSRLAGAGMFLLDSAVQLPQGWEAFVEEFMAAMTKPIADRGLASAVVPFPLQLPVPQGKVVKDVAHHLVFATPFDEHVLELLEGTRFQLATAMDMPAEALTGEQQNHWGKAATEEQGVKVHVVPNLELVCDGLTTGFLNPILIRNGVTDAPRRDGERVLREAVDPVALVDDQDAEVIVWYDLADFSAPVDQSEAAEKAYDRWELGGDGYRRAIGLSEAQDPDKNQADFERRVWTTLIDKGGDAGLVGLALQKLGLVSEDELPAPSAGQLPAAPAEEEDETVPDTGAPEPLTEPDDPAPSDDGPVLVPARAAAIATGRADRLADACDQLVLRALERAGNRVRSKGRGARGQQLGVPLNVDPELLHTRFDVTSLAPASELLALVWAGRLRPVAERCEVDATLLEALLTDYTSALLEDQEPHSYDRLVDYLRAARGLWAPTSRSA